MYNACFFLGSIITKYAEKLKAYVHDDQFLHYSFIICILENRCKYVVHMPPDKCVYNKKCLSYFSTKTYVVGTQKNNLIETLLLSIHTVYVSTDG